MLLRDQIDVCRQIGNLLMQRRERLAVAESCTGGLIAKSLTDVPGSSAWFDCGVVTYSNRAKNRFLSVAETLIDEFGAVSEHCVTAMVGGLLQHTETDWGIAVTGIAGPGGGQPDKPVGTVWIAWQHREHPADTIVQRFTGDRETVRSQTAAVALQGMLGRLVRASRSPGEV